MTARILRARISGRERLLQKMRARRENAVLADVGIRVAGDEEHLHLGPAVRIRARARARSSAA